MQEFLDKEESCLFVNLKSSLSSLIRCLIRSRSTAVADDLNQFYRIVHTLKGSAPIFGYVRIGKLAEDLVRAWEWTQSMDKDGEELLLAINPIIESAEHSINVTS